MKKVNFARKKGISVQDGNVINENIFTDGVFVTVECVEGLGNQYTTFQVIDKARQYITDDNDFLGHSQ